MKSSNLVSRLLITFGFLLLYRASVFIPVPGVDVDALRSMLFPNGNGGVFGMANMFSGGALENFSILTLGIAPYITVSIILQLLTASVPALAALKEQGLEGRRALSRLTRILTIFLALIQGSIVISTLNSQGLISGGWLVYLVAVLTLTAGSSFVMWLGEQISERGFGNGISLLICAGIMARIPSTVVAAISQVREGITPPAYLLGAIALLFGIVLTVILGERAVRKLVIMFPKRAVAGMVSSGGSQTLPLKMNMSGVLPPIFAGAVMMVPAYAISYIPTLSGSIVGEIFAYGSWGYNVIFAALTMFFCFFYLPIVFDPIDVSKSIVRNGGYIAGVRPGEETSTFLMNVLNRLTPWGAFYLIAVCVIPPMLFGSMGLDGLGFVFSGTSVLIVVAVVLDALSQYASMRAMEVYNTSVEEETSSLKVSRRKGRGALKRSSTRPEFVRARRSNVKI